MITEGTLFIVKTAEGYVVTEATNYTYTNEATAMAFARDKWGQENPRMATETETLLERAKKFAADFYNIPIAVTVHGGNVYGAYIGNWEPYDLRFDPMEAQHAIEMGLFTVEREGELNGFPVKWWMNRRQNA